RSGMAFSNRPYEVDGNASTRRLFRPSISDFKRSTRNTRGGNGNGNRPAPPESTNAENFYYLKQMGAKTPMVIVMTDGETLYGWVARDDQARQQEHTEGAAQPP